MLYYTDWCPFTYYGVPRVQTAPKEHNIPPYHEREIAQDISAPVMTYALFSDGRFLTHAIQSVKKFLALAEQRQDTDEIKRIAVWIILLITGILRS